MAWIEGEKLDPYVEVTGQSKNRWLLDSIMEALYGFLGAPLQMTRGEILGELAQAKKSMGKGIPRKRFNELRRAVKGVPEEELDRVPDLFFVDEPDYPFGDWFPLEGEMNINLGREHDKGILDTFLHELVHTRHNPKPQGTSRIEGMFKVWKGRGREGVLEALLSEHKAEEVAKEAAEKLEVLLRKGGYMPISKEAYDKVYRSTLINQAKKFKRFYPGVYQERLSELGEIFE